MSYKIRIFVSVKQQVNDINEILTGLLSELKELRGTVASQHAEICSLNRNVDRLLKENRELRKRLEKYEKPPNDSGNSSTPPSKEPMASEIARRTKSQRRKSDKKAGGQPGHEGTTRKMVDTPDEIEKKMIAVTDRHSAYFAIDFLNNQVCLAHLLRNLEYLNDIDKEQTWANEIQSLLREAIHMRNERPLEVIPKQSWLERLDELLKRNLDNLQKEFNELKRGIIKRRDHIFNFLENPAIPSDNNASERGIRKLKVKQKISGCFRSDTGADAFHALHSIADTAWKNGQSPLDAIMALV